MLITELWEQLNAKDAGIAKLHAQLNAESDIQAMQRDEIARLTDLVAVGREIVMDIAHADAKGLPATTLGFVTKWRSLEGER